ncbi:HAD family hydrolase [Georgenia sp. AZ-5]|uniref:HAD family hydrolase n=1 Tax=Georgenia sp. AZ-5 TaxID=3367526 RepID=UPI0037552E44
MAGEVRSGTTGAGTVPAEVGPAVAARDTGAPREPARAAAFFDLDKTVLWSSSSVVLARPLLAAGLLSRSDLARSAVAQLGYLFVSSSHRHSERVREQLSRTVDGWEVHRFRAVVDGALRTFVQPYVFLEALDLITAHQEAGADVVIVSASSTDVVRPIATMVGADEVIASTMEVRDGRYTGRIADYVYGPAKAARMRDLADRNGYDLAASYAYTDSVTDLPMLEAVGHPVAVNPDRALRRVAARHGWQVRRFERPVPLRAQVPRPVPLGVGAALALTGAAGWWVLRRSRR